MEFIAEVALLKGWLEVSAGMQVGEGRHRFGTEGRGPQMVTGEGCEHLWSSKGEDEGDEGSL